MKVKDIIKTSATLLGKENVVKYLTDENQETDLITLSEVNTFVTLLNTLLEELASGYIPMVKTEDIGGKQKVAFSDLTEKILKIVAFYNANGNEVSYTQNTDHAIVYGYAETISYEYLPSSYGLNDVIGYTKEITVLSLAYGLAGEFCITQGRYEEGVFFHQKFVDSIENVKKIKGKTMAVRVWR